MFKHIVTTAIILAVCLSFSACEKQADSSNRFADPSPTSERINEKVGETAGGAKSSLLEKKREYEKKIKVELENFDSLISDLKKKAQSATVEAKEVLTQAVDELEEKKQALETRLEEFEAAGAEASQRLQTQLEAALEDLRKSYEEAAPKSR